VGVEQVGEGVGVAVGVEQVSGVGVAVGVEHVAVDVGVAVGVEHACIGVGVAVGVEHVGGVPVGVGAGVQLEPVNRI